MNHLKSSASCRVCRRWFEGDWAKAETVERRQNLDRQMWAGICDACQRDRWSAAVEYEGAAAEIRLLIHLGADIQSGKPPKFLPLFSKALDRAKAAEARCIRLGMWSWERPPTDPGRYLDPDEPREKRDA